MFLKDSLLQNSILLIYLELKILAVVGIFQKMVCVLFFSFKIIPKLSILPCPLSCISLFTNHSNVAFLFMRLEQSSRPSLAIYLIGWNDHKASWFLNWILAKKFSLHSVLRVNVPLRLQSFRFYMLELLRLNFLWTHDHLAKTNIHLYACIHTSTVLFPPAYNQLCPGVPQYSELSWESDRKFPPVLSAPISLEPQ